MSAFEILKRKIALQKQWLWMLVNMSDKELKLPRRLTREMAKNKALERLKQLLEELENLEK